MQNKTPNQRSLVQIVIDAAKGFIKGALGPEPQEKPKGLARLFDQYLAKHRMRTQIKSKIKFPPIHQRPPFHIEMAIAYLIGVASAFTCELVHSSHAYASTVHTVASVFGHLH